MNSRQTPSADALAGSLAGELVARHIELASEQTALLAEYCRRLWDWNQRLNLTRHTDASTFVARDVVDSLAIAGQLQGSETLLDLGTGGGVPGLIVAILRSDVRVSVCESVAKKAHAVADIVSGLGLTVEVFAQRGEDVLGSRCFDTVTVRAVGRMDKLLRTLAPYWHAMGRLLLLKGPQWVAERGAARHAGLLRTLELRKLQEYRSGEGYSVLLQLRAKR